jgi:hypothetical protein
MSFAVKDAGLKVTRALNASASSTVKSTSIDLGLGSKGDFVQPCEFKVSAPAVNTTMAPDTRTFTYDVIHSDNSDLSSSSVIYTAVITQTGASSAGAAAADATVRLPVDAKRYVGIQIRTSASTGDASSVSATFEALL